MILFFSAILFPVSILRRPLRLTRVSDGFGVDSEGGGCEAFDGEVAIVEESTLEFVSSRRNDDGLVQGRLGKVETMRQSSDGTNGPREASSDRCAY